jgi:hypothetical protein
MGGKKFAFAFLPHEPCKSINICDTSYSPVMSMDTTSAGSLASAKPPMGAADRSLS